MIDDDALDGRLFRARPDTPLRGAPLTGEQEELLASIMASAGVARPRRARGSKTVLERWSLAAALLLVLVVVSATVSVWPVQTSHAVAVTPRALQIQPLQGNAENLLLELSESVAAAAEPRPATTIRFEFWGLALSPQGSSVSMQPHETLLDYRSDGSTAVETRALQALAADGSPVDDPDARDAGELVLWHLYKKGEAVGVFSKPSLDTEWGSLLREGERLPADADAAGYFRAVANLLSEHPLSGSEQSELVRFLATLPDIHVEGELIDRLGRPGVGFVAPDGDYRRMLIISPELGVLAYESVYTGSSRTDVPSPAVIDYKAWY